MMSEPIQSLLDNFPEGVIQVRGGVVQWANPMARRYLPQLREGSPLPDCLPCPKAPRRRGLLHLRARQLHLQLLRDGGQPDHLLPPRSPDRPHRSPAGRGPSAAAGIFGENSWQRPDLSPRGSAPPPRCPPPPSARAFTGLPPDGQSGVYAAERLGGPSLPKRLPGPGQPVPPCDGAGPGGPWRPPGSPWSMRARETACSSPGTPNCSPGCFWA